MSGYDDPGYLRHCMLPDCGAQFNIMTGEGLLPQPTAWRQLTQVVPGYLCPAHAPAVTSRAHLPHWVNPGADPPGLCGIGCACGWTWMPVRPATAGQHGDQWLAHLADAVSTAVGPS